MHIKVSPMPRLIRWLNAWIVRLVKKRLASGAIKSPADMHAALRLVQILEENGINRPERSE